MLRKFIQGCIDHSRLLLLIVGVLTLAGAYAILVMPKQEFPQFTIRQGVVVAVYPGATAQQVEEQVAKPLEEFMFTYKELKRKKTFTQSQDGMLLMRVELNDDVDNKDQAWSKIKHGLSQFKSQLPPGVLALVANDDFGDTSALLITLESRDKTYRQLQDLLTDLEGRLRRVESVSNLRRYGVQKEQIAVYVDRDKLAGYGLSLNRLMAELSLAATTTGGASLDDGAADMPLHVTAQYADEYEVAQQIIGVGPGGDNIRLKDIAHVVREYPDPDSYVTNNGNQAVVLSLEARPGYNIVDVGRQVDRVLDDFRGTLPPSVQITRIADQPKVVNTSVTSFLRDLLLSILIVIGVMLVLFSLRSAIVAALSIPISIFICLAIMYAAGIELNTVTLAVLIVVLGMIVDNSVIVIDAYVGFLDQGMGRKEAAIRSARDYFGSILLATICICALFYPTLWTFTGQFHDFIKLFPWTFTIAMMTSLMIAMTFIPFVEYVLIKKGNKTDGKQDNKMFALVQRSYEAMLAWTFRHPWLTIWGTVGLVVAGGVLMGLLPQRMMPKIDRDQFAVEVYLPQGTPLSRTRAVADSVRALLQADHRVRSVTSFIGTGAPRFQNSYAPQPASKHFAQLIVNTADNHATVDILDDMANRYAHHWPDAYVKFKQLDYSVADAPVEIRLRGDDNGQLQRWADSVQAVLRRRPELTWVHTSMAEPQPSVSVALDATRATQAGVTRALASAELAAAYGGVNAGTVWEGNYPLAVVLKTRDDRQGDDASRVGDEYISTLAGGKVPLRQVADVKADWQPGQLVRRNGVRTVSVLADVKRGQLESRALDAALADFEAQVAPKLPPGVAYEYGGTYENNVESAEKLPKTLIIAFGIIFAFMLVNFKKISLASTALASILLCLPGAAIGLLIWGMEFSLTVFLGIIALLGINMRNAIIMFAHAEERRRDGATTREAAFDAGCRRMVPIFLTSATTAVGIIPMILSRSPLWAPMGVVILCGTVLSMLLVVLVMPVAYWKLYGDKAQPKPVDNPNP